MYKVAEAIKQLHDKKIVHLNMNLMNIVVDESQRNFKFMDYGCCTYVKVGG